MGVWLRFDPGCRARFRVSSRYAGPEHGEPRDLAYSVRANLISDMRHSVRRRSLITRLYTDLYSRS